MFSISQEHKNGLGRAGVIKTPNGNIETPAFVAVGTAGSVKSLTVEMVKEAGAQAVLSNTYHLHLRPGEGTVQKAGGLAKFMNWKGPTFTDSGGFQVFSLGAAYGKGISKFSKKENESALESGAGDTEHAALTSIDEDGVTFRSHIDGTEHRLTPEKSMEIQSSLGADIIFAFDECTSPSSPRDYQKEAMERTHRWAKRSLASHQKLRENAQARQFLFGIVQGGRFGDLRTESARFISSLDFDGFGIGGSFDKEDIQTTLAATVAILPKEKPRHLLGIGEPEDLFLGVESGADTFDCVTPTRLGRNGTLYTKRGKVNLHGARFAEDWRSVEDGCGCYTCRNYSAAYLAHLFRAKEMLAGTLGSIHNLYFLVNLVSKMRTAILDGNFEKFKKEFLKGYKSRN